MKSVQIWEILTSRRFCKLSRFKSEIILRKIVKLEILALTKQKLAHKISTLENLIAETRAANNETKSSMGDKYETSREMVQQEINNLQIQLGEHLRAQEVLTKISSALMEKAGSGSLVETDKGLFYIAVSLGEMNFNNKKIFLISPESPLAKAMNGKSAGEKFTLNGTEQTIKNIW